MRNVTASGKYCKPVNCYGNNHQIGVLYLVGKIPLMLNNFEKRRLERFVCQLFVVFPSQLSISYQEWMVKNLPYYCWYMSTPAGANLRSSCKRKVESDATFTKRKSKKILIVIGCRIIAVACSSLGKILIRLSNFSQPILLLYCFQKLAWSCISLVCCCILRAKTQASLLQNLFTILHPLMQPRNGKAAISTEIIIGFTQKSYLSKKCSWFSANDSKRKLSHKQIAANWMKNSLHNSSLVDVVRKFEKYAHNIPIPFWKTENVEQTMVKVRPSRKIGRNHPILLSTLQFSIRGGEKLWLNCSWWSTFSLFQVGGCFNFLENCNIRG